MKEGKLHFETLLGNSVMKITEESSYAAIPSLGKIIIGILILTSAQIYFLAIYTISKFSKIKNRVNMCYQLVFSVMHAENPLKMDIS